MPANDDRCVLHVDQFGRGEPLLFVHGFPLTGAMWHPTAEHLSERWRCIVPDLRGHGRSPASAGVSIARFSDDLVAVLDGLGERRPVVLIGLSMGGIIGFDFFRRYRSRLRALVLADTRADAESPDGVARREALAASVLREGSRAAVDTMIGQLFAPAIDPTLRQRWAHVMAANPPAGVAAAAGALATRADSEPTLARIDCPTLVVVGEHDAITPAEMMREMAAKIPRARFEVLAGAGHVPPVEQPERFAGIVRSFLEELESAGRAGAG